MRGRSIAGWASLVRTAAIAGALAVLVSAPPARAHVRITTDLNWSEDVRPILRRHCMVCHSPGGPAPSYVDLRTYGTDSAPGARAWAAAIEEELLTGRMPPWQADPRFDAFGNTRRLTKAELDTVIGWIRGGAPQGPRRNLPPPPEFEADAWQLGEPDRIAAPPEPVVVAEGDSEESRTFELPIEVDADTWVTGFEFRPQNPRVVYRMAAWIVDPPSAPPEKLEVEIQVPYDPFRAETDKPPTRWYELPHGEHFLGQWVRGDAPVLAPDGMGHRLRQGSTVRLEIEYRRVEDDGGGAVEDLSKLGLFLARAPDQVDLILLARELRGNDGAVTAAGRKWLKDEARRRRASGDPPPLALLDFEETVRLVSLQPNFGAAVEDVDVALVYPDGHTQELLLIDDYDAKWPASFHLREPLIAPAGSRLVLSGSSRSGVDGAAGRPFDLEVGYALDDHLVLPPPQVAASPQSQGGMLVGADIEGAVALLPKGVSSTPPSIDPRAAAHMDHSPLHGGQFFMAANSYHHLEGALPRPGEFDLYVYDDYKRPLDPRNFAGVVVFETFDKAKNEWSETSYPLELAEPGAQFLRARIPETMPAEFFASVWLAGETSRFDFYFEEPSRELTQVELARYASLGPHSHQRPPLIVPEAAGAVVAELELRTQLLRDLIERRDWLALHIPAFDAIDLAEALLDKLEGLPARDQGLVRQAVARTLQSAAEIDRAGDLADPGRVQRAFARYDEAVKTVVAAFR
ncbi:MAG TPA: hypothetical protein VHR17_08170 [Thermoanaerobaculia bacterium]|nr:hypothetical protein [Thermoanaerobaculia bacterium]